MDSKLDWNNALSAQIEIAIFIEALAFHSIVFRKTIRQK